MIVSTIYWSPAMGEALMLYGTESPEFRRAFRSATVGALLAADPEKPDDGDVIPDEEDGDANTEGAHE